MYSVLAGRITAKSPKHRTDIQNKCLPRQMNAQALCSAFDGVFIIFSYATANVAYSSFRVQAGCDYTGVMTNIMSDILQT